MTSLFTRNYLERLSQKIASDAMDELINKGHSFHDTIVILSNRYGLAPEYITETNRHFQPKLTKEDVYIMIKERNNDSNNP